MYIGHESFRCNRREQASRSAHSARSATGLGGRCRPFASQDPWSEANAPDAGRGACRNESLTQDDGGTETCCDTARRSRLAVAQSTMDRNLPRGDIMTSATCNVVLARAVTPPQSARLPGALPDGRLPAKEADFFAALRAGKSPQAAAPRTPVAITTKTIRPHGREVYT